MPLVRKIIRVGTSRGITLPEDWLKWLEMRFGEAPKEVFVEVDEELRIKPVVKGVAVSSKEA
jgi:antitoxin component of MazEF toxin-antitoxin module